MSGLRLEEVAEGIAATMGDTDRVFVTGDGFSGGIDIGPEPLDRANRPIAFGVRRPELDDFAQMIRDAHARRRP